MATRRKSKQTKPPASSSPPPVVDADPTRCPKCGSSRRAPYHHCKEQRFAGKERGGRAFTATFWKRTQCLDCGQHRIDRSHEYAAQAK